MSFFFKYLNTHHTLYWTTQGGTRASLAIMSRAYFSFNAVQVSALFCHARPGVKSPQPGIKPFSTLLTAHFGAVSYKPVCGHLHKNGIFGTTKRNTGEI